MPTAFALLLVLCLFGRLAPATAQEIGANQVQDNAVTQSATLQPAITIPDALKTPRAAVNNFLDAMQQVRSGDKDALKEALQFLDLSKISTLVVNERGTDLAWMLLDVIEQTSDFDKHSIPDRLDENSWILHSYDNADLVLQNSGKGWQFSSATLKVLPEIADTLKQHQVSPQLSDLVAGSDTNDNLPLSSRLRKSIPEQYKGEVLSLQYWQWVGIFFFVLAGLLADTIFASLMRFCMHFLSSHAEKPSFRNLNHDMLRPFGLMIMALVWWIGINQLSLPETSLLILLISVKFLVSVSGVWAAYRLVDLITAWLGDRAAQTESKLDDALVPLVKRTLKIFVTVVGLIFIANNLNIDITGLIAGLGLGGLAFALAAKDLAQNLFGSITVLMEKTFMVGDWIKVGDVEGTVENIGFRSTRIRTFYNSQITLPNSNLITASVDNLGKRRYRRLSTTLQITYDTPPDQVESFCEGIREIIRLHPYMRKDYYHVYLNGFSASALDIMLYVFWETPDWNTELRERHRLLLDIMRLAKRLGVDFAYPTQTLYWRDETEHAKSSTSHDYHSHNAHQIAREIVEESTGVDVKPDPVKIPKKPLSKVGMTKDLV